MTTPKDCKQPEDCWQFAAVPEQAKTRKVKKYNRTMSPIGWKLECERCGAYIRDDIPPAVTARRK